MASVSSVDRYRASLTHVEVLDAEAERRLAAAWRAGDRDAGRRLVEASLPFVVRIAREYRRWRVPLEDLVQQGNLGLLKAADRYDPDKGYRLVTYAAYWIRAEIRDYVVRSYRIVRLGSTRTERRAMRTYRREGADSAADLAEKSGMPRARAEKLWPLLATGDLSLDARYDEHAPAIERLPVAPAADPEAELVRQETKRGLQEVLGEALGRLSDRERRIVDARMLADDPCTLEHLGREMGVSKERVRQIEARARHKLRRSLADFEPIAA